MNSFSENALILVAVMPNIKDLEIARLLGWYRIPLRMAPKLIDVDYLAFYQTSSFGEAHRWMIEFAAPVQGHELTTRSVILREEPDHPRAHEEYYKIQIGPLQKLDPPLPAANWKRITFLYTLGEMMNQAATISDLVLKSEDKDILWKCLRERKRAYASTNPEKQLDLFENEELLKLLCQITNLPSEHELNDI